MRITDIMQLVADEHDLDLNDAKMNRKILKWLNTIYRQVVNSEEFPWRFVDYSLAAQGPVTGTAQVTNGQTLWKPITYSGFPSVASYGIVRFGEQQEYYDMASWVSILCDLKQPYHGETVSAPDTIDFTIYQPRYEVPDIQEDWIKKVWYLTDKHELERIWPNDKVNFVRRGIEYNDRPRRYFVGYSTYHYGNETEPKVPLLNLSPVPDKEYQLIVTCLIGPTVLTAESANTMLPDDFEPDIFDYGCGMLYCMSQRDKVGGEYYSKLFSNLMKKMSARAQREPDSLYRMMGYIVRDSDLVDQDLPADWELSTV